MVGGFDFGRVGQHSSVMSEFDRERHEFDNMPLRERLVNPFLPEFEAIEPNEIRKLTHGDREIIVHHYNTMVVLYPEGSEYEMFDHIVIADQEQFPEPYYIFPEPSDLLDDVDLLTSDESDAVAGEEFDDFFDLTISKLQFLGVTTMYPAYPQPYVISRYYPFARGSEPIDAGLRRIIDESQGK